MFFMVGYYEEDAKMTNPGKAKTAQDQNKYSASDANKNNQKQNAETTGKTAREGKDPMSGKSDIK